MIDYVFYIKGSPLGNTAYKIGISALKHIGSRLGTYQNTYGPTYEERFEQVWVGTEQEVRELERLLKIKFRHNMAGRTRGYTEWVKNLSYTELFAEVEATIKGLGLDIVIPKGFTKLFEHDIEKLTQTYLVEADS